MFTTEQIIKGLSAVLLLYMTLEMINVRELKFLKWKSGRSLKSDVLKEPSRGKSAEHTNGISLRTTDPHETKALDYPVDSLSRKSRNEINYADERLGAYIESYDAKLARPRNLFDIVGIAIEDNAPEEMIRANMQPGACFAFKRAHNTAVTIALAARIYIDALELQHMPKYESPSKSTESAPRHFSAIAIHDNNDEEHHLGDFEFENIASYQIFPTFTADAFQKIRIYFKSNHGHPDVTCVYKLAVYGRLPPSDKQDVIF